MQKKKKFKITIVSTEGLEKETKIVSGKKEALREAIKLGSAPIKDPVHLLGIKERTDKTASVGDLWDCLELIQGIFLDWKVERPWLLYPKFKEMKAETVDEPSATKTHRRKRKNKSR